MYYSIFGAACKCAGADFLLFWKKAMGGEATRPKRLCGNASKHAVDEDFQPDQQQDGPAQNGGLARQPGAEGLAQL